MRLLLAHPDDEALAASVLARLDDAIIRLHVMTSARMEGARHGDDFDALLAEHAKQDTAWVQDASDAVL